MTRAPHVEGGAAAAHLKPARKSAKPGAPTLAAPRNGWVAALNVLDDVLALAVDAQARTLGADARLDPWRGMHLRHADVERLLARERVDTLPQAGVAELLAEAALQVPPLARARSWLSLSAVDLAATLIAIAPDIDLRYERIYGYLQDDISRRRPSIDLVINLLGSDAAERLAIGARFDAAAPAMASGLLLLRAAADMPRLAQPVLTDELWRHWLLGRVELDTSLAACARLLTPRAVGIDETAMEPAVRTTLRQLLDGQTKGGGLRLLVHGAHGAGKFAVAQALAHDAGLRLLDVDVRSWSSPGEVGRQLPRVLRASALFDALPFVRGITALTQTDEPALRALVDGLAASPAFFVLATQAPWAALHSRPLAVVRIALGYPSAPERRQVWQQALNGGAANVSAADIERVSRLFSLSAAQIEQAACDALIQAALEGRASLSSAQLSAAARWQSGSELARLAQRVKPQADFSTLVTVPEVAAQLREMCSRVATRDIVRRDWAGGCVHARNVGITALFAGPSGTGKTLAAEAIANELGLDLYRIDLAAVVSKYIGETEKNLDRVFTAAEHANAVLFFDEADSLFGKRSEVKDAHDRYANIEIAYLLQKMEQFDGLAILATNLKQNLDDAFARRLTFTLNFPFPEIPERERLWRELWPPRAPKADDVDLAWFAREFRLSGGNIRNTVLAAAHLAVADGQVITRAHLLHATRREFQKLGKNLPPIPANGTAA
jgi:AAA+ superfamily predicted ATPase